ncbi:hypothetical protein RND81_04G198900 [Saponaria officinalis]|uniref:Peptidase A1 domain-containing protein n=1 Tax=Saponaria officinalis TaxID=3572 RepID=A0AAW1LNW6_SAPOF
MMPIILLHFIFQFISFINKTNAFSMSMYPIDSPRLKILPDHFTKEDRYQFLRNISFSRAYNFNKRNSKLGPNSIDYSLSHLDSGYFLTQLNFGTLDRPFSPYVIIDMASDHTWVQCAACDPCFKLGTSISAESSTSYAKLTLDDKRCDTKQSYEGVCGFDSYFGNAHTQGYLGTDTFSFSNTAGGLSYFPNIVYGCGIHNQNFDWGAGSGKIAGVHGLSVGPRSFLNQLSDEIKGRFTYCLPTDPDEIKITFGDAATISGDVETIAMNPDARYHLYLEAISVDEIHLPIPSSAFELDDKNFKSGFFLDPSTPTTMLTTEAYVELVSALTLHFGTYEWFPIPFTTGHASDLCYFEEPLPELAQFYPPIAFHFRESASGGESKLAFDNDLIYRTRHPLPGFCLNVGLTTGPSIFGAHLQANHRFLFDINAKEVKYSPEDC